MKNSLTQIAPEVANALEKCQGVVALESTLISHGLPWPTNLETALASEEAVRKSKAVPATIAVLKGRLTVGLSHSEIEALANNKDIAKVSVRDLPVLMARRADGATTVASTLMIAHRAGIRVMATGGIGGVHRDAFSGDSPTLDISADLPVLARTPVILVCSGAKSILDLRATREWLETHGVTVLGFRTDEFPGFYTTHTGLRVDARTNSIAEIVEIARARWSLELEGAILVGNPPPADLALPAELIETHLREATAQMEHERVSGKDVTPFLLSRLQQATEGKATRLNSALIIANAALAGEVAAALAQHAE
ncbi:pseudouridine-5'-phosphate glycosidase [Candidatus Acetothermia bacterium]|nr:pseudouridine-5'-phosphate glycosidase [Candidatus Acetothermia bacterium]